MGSAAQEPQTSRLKEIIDTCNAVALTGTECGGETCNCANLPSHMLCLYLQASMCLLQCLCNHLVAFQDSKNSRLHYACAVFGSCSLKGKNTNR